MLCVYCEYFCVTIYCFTRIYVNYVVGVVIGDIVYYSQCASFESIYSDYYLCFTLLAFFFSWSHD